MPHVGGYRAVVVFCWGKRGSLMFHPASSSPAPYLTANQYRPAIGATGSAAKTSVIAYLCLPKLYPRARDRGSFSAILYLSSDLFSSTVEQGARMAAALKRNLYGEERRLRQSLQTPKLDPMPGVSRQLWLGPIALRCARCGGDQPRDGRQSLRTTSLLANRWPGLNGRGDPRLLGVARALGATERQRGSPARSQAP